MLSFGFLLGVFMGALLYFKVLKPAKYWSERHVPHPPSWPIIGNMGPFVTKSKHMLDIVVDIYNNFPQQRYVGFMQFTSPGLILRDLDLIKQAVVKDFDHFHDHLTTNTSDDALLSKSLISLTGENWRQMRATLSPAFTSSKMKTMYHLMTECAENFVQHFKGKEQVAVEMKDIFSRFTNDVIATTAFGIQTDSLKEPNHEFFTMGQKLTTFTFVQAIKLSIIVISPALAKRLGVQMLPQDIAQFFRTVIKDNMSKREIEKIIRPDLIHLLMEARKGNLKHETSKEEKGESFASVEESDVGKTTKQMDLTDDHVVAQALLFFFAGFDTASTASCFMAYELAIHPDMQKRLQEEIDEAHQKHGGKIPYEALMAMKYLDQVISETLRKWPPGFQTDRQCTKDYNIPPKKAGETGILLEKGNLVVIPIMALHRDAQYYPEPDRFDPGRFNEENREKIVPGSFLPFGIGPRNCIGSRFALLEMKTLFFHLLSTFDIVPIDRTEIPIRISPKKVNLAPEDGFHLGLKPRTVTSL